MHELIFEDEAQGDQKDRAEYYESQIPGLGDRFNLAIDQRLRAILWNPYLYAIHEGAVRVTDIEKFQELIYYRIRGNRVHILAIIHGPRHPDTWKRRRR